MISTVRHGGRTAKRAILTLTVLAAALLAPNPAAAAEPNPNNAIASLRVLVVSDIGFHDYTEVTRALMTNLALRINAKFDAVPQRAAIKEARFAEGYDVVVYDACFDDQDAPLVSAARAIIRAGKPAVLLHCSVHMFRHFDHTPEECCGINPDATASFPSFNIEKRDALDAITRKFPAVWKTPGGEPDRILDLLAGAHPLLTAKNSWDGRAQVVCWTQSLGQGRVFALSLGHDAKTSISPDYLGLVANGLLWTCDKLDENGEPKPGYSAKN